MNRFFALLFLALALSGCGGGSSEDNTLKAQPSTGGMPKEQVQR